MCCAVQHWSVCRRQPAYTFLELQGVQVVGVSCCAALLCAGLYFAALPCDVLQIMDACAHVRVVDGTVYFRYGGFMYHWFRLRRLLQTVKMVQASHVTANCTTSFLQHPGNSNSTHPGIFLPLQALPCSTVPLAPLICSTMCTFLLAYPVLYTVQSYSGYSILPSVHCIVPLYFTALHCTCRTR